MQRASIYGDDNVYADYDQYSVLCVCVDPGGTRLPTGELGWFYHQRLKIASLSPRLAGSHRLQ